MNEFKQLFIIGCGGIINLSAGQQQLIESPNYPNTYNVDKECVWMIRVRIEITTCVFIIARSWPMIFRFYWSELQEADSITYTETCFFHNCGYLSTINELPRKLVSTNKFCFSAIIDHGELLDSKDFD